MALRSRGDISALFLQSNFTLYRRPSQGLNFCLYPGRVMGFPEPVTDINFLDLGPSRILEGPMDVETFSDHRADWRRCPLAPGIGIKVINEYIFPDSLSSNSNFKIQIPNPFSLIVLKINVSSFGVSDLSWVKAVPGIRHSGKAKILKDCELIVWDECTMSYKAAFEALNITLKDIRRNNNRMVGVTMVLAGDFRQTLPVIPRGTRVDEMQACLKSSYLWNGIQRLGLTTNM
ncbi:hypothetical protein AVEN_111452-1 [Araneus ventricosus]|uniref:ATP-dependent DNA helicase n=1 Tax=Araneus ventricosus TaxID=182803 RepID=A0A4Y2K124_ARAVE|nr:hypothetical protein AVEN_111452-1 [Araneus ventricosus]